jgi:hypothetical protein
VQNSDHDLNAERLKELGDTRGAASKALKVTRAKVYSVDINPTTDENLKESKVGSRVRGKTRQNPGSKIHATRDTSIPVRSPRALLKKSPIKTISATHANSAFITRTRSTKLSDSSPNMARHKPRYDLSPVSLQHLIIIKNDEALANPDAHRMTIPSLISPQSTNPSGTLNIPAPSMFFVRLTTEDTSEAFNCIRTTKAKKLKRIYTLRFVR